MSQLYNWHYYQVIICIWQKDFFFFKFWREIHIISSLKLTYIKSHSIWILHILAIFLRFQTTMLRSTGFIYLQRSSAPVHLRSKRQRASSPWRRKSWWWTSTSSNRWLVPLWTGSYISQKYWSYSNFLTINHACKYKSLHKMNK